MSICPDNNDMACYVDGLLLDDEARQLERHLLGCDRCREEVEVTRKILQNNLRIFD